jgi:hypothetical protein
MFEESYEQINTIRHWTFGNGEITVIDEHQNGHNERKSDRITYNQQLP